MSLKIIKVYSVDYNKTGMFTNVTGFSSHEKFGECGTFTLSLGFQTDDTFLKIGTIINVEDYFGIGLCIPLDSSVLRSESHGR